MGGNNINSDVPILLLVDPNSPNIANNGTISISGPAPTTPVARPVNTPIIVKPSI